jgi:tryptophan synthase alpha chain
MSLSEVFSRAQAENRAALIVYITAGDPSLDATVDLGVALHEAGADLVELGLPYSDPLADGPIIQAAGQRALAAGATVAGVLDAARRIRERVPLPLLIMTCFNPILQFGPERFAEQAAAAGVSAVLISDLPPEESAEWTEIAARHGVETVFLVAPTTEPERLKLACDLSTGFVYVVSRAGVTGVRESLPPELPALVGRLRGITGRPLAVGFGLSSPEHVAAVAQIADGAIVGSAVVRVIGEKGAGSEMVEAVTALVRRLRAATAR